ncbi:MAG: transglutaminase domain-containing protein [Aquabacterium sp.]|nr:transglutaminase domain-containing protein [Aquabacterium sp.]
MTLRRSTWWFGLVVVVSALLTLLYLSSNVSTSLTQEDVAAFRSMGLKPLAQSLTHEEQVKLVRRVQRMVFERSPLDKGIAEGQAREPADLLRLGHGLCFDRSRALDKALSYLGFQTRHVFLLYRQGKSFSRALFSRRQWSHAVTEVRLGSGWVLVDSLTPWVAVTKEGLLVDADHVWSRSSEFESIPEYLVRPWWAIRGLYSRGGGFYHAFLELPEVNYADFFSWVLDLP